MTVFPAGSERSSADKTQMTTQCPLHDTIHREKGQRKRALEKSSLSEEVSYVPQKQLCARNTRSMFTGEFSVETKDSKKALYGFKCNRNTKKQAHIRLYGTKIKVWRLIVSYKHDSLLPYNAVRDLTCMQVHNLQRKLWKKKIPQFKVILDTMK